jgi:DNA helicase-2/ATP-dependent DNA helicase PcrA
MKLTKDQKEAVEYIEGPLLIVAGPGAGKTRVLIEKIAYLIQEKNVDPNSILVTTFTVKAANQLKDRLSTRIGNKVENMQVSTIHSFCQRILESNPEFHHLGTQIDVLDDQTQFMFFRFNLHNIGIDFNQYRYNLDKIISIFNLCTENCIDPTKLIEYYQTFEDGNKEQNITLANAYLNYLNLLEMEKKIDFAGLQKMTYRLLKDKPEVLNGLRSKYQYILVDEYQDTNPIQDELFRMLAEPHNKIFVVGDEDQSIYGFRGASVNNFRRFPKRYKNTKVVKLETNFRSTSDIVDVSNFFIGNRRAIDKSIKPKRGKGNEIVLVYAGSIADEAKESVGLIKEMKEKGIIKHYGDVAILFRSVRSHAPEYILELKRQKIPYHLIGDKGFFQREEIRSILYLMAKLDGFEFEENQRFYSWGSWWNDLTLLILLPFSTRVHDFISERSGDFDFIKEMEENWMKYKDKFEPEDISLIKRLILIKKKLAQKKEKGTPDMLLELYYEVLDKTGYLKKLMENSEENEEYLLNLAQLSQIINKFESIRKRPSMDNLLWYLYQLPENKDFDEATIEDPKAVKVMTVHQAKGLEFPVVFMGSVIKGRFPVERNENLADNKFMPIPREFLLDPEQFSDLNEERRLFYVGITRAQDNLVICTSEIIRKNRKGPSKFITNEIGLDKFKDKTAIKKPCEESYDIEDEVPRVSYSAINTFLDCPFRYQLAYQYNFQTPPSFFQNYGIIVHNVLYKTHLKMKQGIVLDYEAIKKLVDESWIPIFKQPKKDYEMKEKVYIEIWNYYNKAKNDYSEIIEIEKPFSYIGEGLIINGRIDLLAKSENGEMELIDFKARKEKGIYTTHVDIQLRMYQMALESEYNIDKLYAYIFEDNMKNQIGNSDYDLKEARDKIFDVCQKIKNREFPATRNQFCPKCEFLPFCRGLKR